MLPFLPALILLLLQGPSNFERLAVDGRLPEALDAIHRQMALPGSDVLTELEEKTLAKLIAAGNAGNLSHVLLSFLWQGEHRPRISSTPPGEPSRPVIACEAPPSTQDGFRSSRRTRDGPAIAGAL